MKLFSLALLAVVVGVFASGLKPFKVLPDCIIIEDFNRGNNNQQFPLATAGSPDAPWLLSDDDLTTNTVIERRATCQAPSDPVDTEDPNQTVTSAFGLYFNDGEDSDETDIWVYRDDTFLGDATDRVEVWTRNTNPTTGVAYLGFWAGAGGSYGFGINYDSGCLEIVESCNWETECLAETYVDEASVGTAGNGLTDGWYRLEVEFLPWGQVVGNLYDSNGFIDSLSTFCGQRYSLGVALHGKGDICFDMMKRDFPAQVVKDPHFTGFDGSKFDVQGEAGKYYNILTDNNVQLNARYRAGCRKNGKSTLMNEFGLSYKFNNLHITTDRITLNDEELPIGERVQLGSADEWVQASDKHHVAVVIDDYVMVFAMNKVKCGGYRIDLKMEARNPTSRPHGLLGQTVRHANDNNSERSDDDIQPLTVHNHQGQGIIHGYHSDYEVSNVFANDFKFNKFGTAAESASPAFKRSPMKREVETPF